MPKKTKNKKPKFVVLVRGMGETKARTIEEVNRVLAYAQDQGKEGQDFLVADKHGDMVELALNPFGRYIVPGKEEYMGGELPEFDDEEPTEMSLPSYDPVGDAVKQIKANLAALKLPDLNLGPVVKPPAPAPTVEVTTDTGVGVKKTQRRSISELAEMIENGQTEEAENVASEGRVPVVDTTSLVRDLTQKLDSALSQNGELRAVIHDYDKNTERLRDLDAKQIKELRDRVSDLESVLEMTEGELRVNRQEMKDWDARMEETQRRNASLSDELLKLKVNGDPDLVESARQEVRDGYTRRFIDFGLIATDALVEGIVRVDVAADEDDHDQMFFKVEYRCRNADLTHYALMKLYGGWQDQESARSSAGTEEMGG